MFYKTNCRQIRVHTTNYLQLYIGTCNMRKPWNLKMNIEKLSSFFNVRTYPQFLLCLPSRPNRLANKRPKR